MKVSRRDLLVWSAGAAAGLIVTPVPWKLLDDVSIWSQNWPWIPQPARGPVEVKRSACTLCEKGCGLRMRMAGGWPVGVAGVTENPVSRGALCPLGFGAHQLNWHPQRLRSVRHRGNTSTWNDAQAAFAKACSEGPVVVIDGRPGRAASQVMEAFAKNRGEYCVVFSPETRPLMPYEAWSGVPASALGYDLENAQTVVSFGVPLLDGWGSPGRLTRLWSERAAGMNDPHLRLIQIEAELSRTAGRAWQWVPIRSGSESALAAGIARVLLEDRLVTASAPMPPVGLETAAEQCGLSADAIRTLAHTIVARPPVVAIANDDNQAIAALNGVLGAVGARGGIVCRSAEAKAYVSADSALPTARAVLVDSSVPWNFIPRTDAEVFRFAAWDGVAGKADWLLPATGFLEELTDIPTPPTLPFESYAVAPMLVQAQYEVRSAAQFLTSQDATLPSTEKMIHARCAELFHGRRGIVYGQDPMPVSKVASAQNLEDQLWGGAVWVGEPADPQNVRCRLKEWPSGTSSTTHPNWLTSWPAPVLPALTTKLVNESDLRERPEGRIA